MKLFKILCDGESYHVAAQTEQEAVNFLSEVEHIGIEDKYTIVEIPKEDWESIVVHYDENDECGNQIKIPANELMGSVTEPELICSSIY